MTRLIHSQQRKTVEDARVDFSTAIRYNTNNDLGICYLPVTERKFVRGTFFHASFPHVREFFREHRCAMFFIRPCIVRQNKTSSSCRSKDQITKGKIYGGTDIVHRNADEQFSGSVTLVLSEEESAVLEVVWVTGNGRVPRESRLPIALS